MGVFREQGVPLSEKETALLFVSHHRHSVAVSAVIVSLHITYWIISWSILQEWTFNSLVQIVRSCSCHSLTFQLNATFHRIC